MNYNSYTNKKIITKINKNNPSSINSLRSIISKLYILIEQTKQKFHYHIILIIINQNNQFKKEISMFLTITNK